MTAEDEHDPDEQIATRNTYASRLLTLAPSDYYCSMASPTAVQGATL